jgi:hypothetical protein
MPKNPLIINSNIRVNNFMLIEVHELVDSNRRIMGDLENIGFRELPKDEYLKAMETEPFSCINEVSDYRV